MVAVAVRTWLIARTVLVSRDGVTFVGYAQGLAQHPLTTMRQQAQHPLYPGAILLTHSLLKPFLGSDPADNWMRAAQIASMLGGLLVIPAAYALGRMMWNRRVGLITGLFAAVLPELARVSADALSDGLHLGLYLCGLAAIIWSLQTGRVWGLLAGAVLSGLAFLTRPEGGTVLAVGLVFVLVGFGRFGWTIQRRLVLAALMVICFAAVAGPYMLTVGRLIQKKNPLELMGLREQASASVGPGYPAQPLLAEVTLPTTLIVLVEWIRTCRVVYFLLAVPAWVTRRVGRPAVSGPLILASLIHLVLVHMLQRSYGYLAGRHTLVLAAATLPFAAATFVWLLDLYVTRRAAKRPDGAPIRQAGAIAVGMFLVVLPTAPKLFVPIGYGRDGIPAVGRRLEQMAKAGQGVLTFDCRIGYYSGLPFQTLGPDPSVGELIGQVEAARPSYLVLETAASPTHADPNELNERVKASGLSPRLEPVHEQMCGRGRGANKAVVYRVRPFGSPAAPGK